MDLPSCTLDGNVIRRTVKPRRRFVRSKTAGAASPSRIASDGSKRSTIAIGNSSGPRYCSDNGACATQPAVPASTAMRKVRRILERSESGLNLRLPILRRGSVHATTTSFSAFDHLRKVDGPARLALGDVLNRAERAVCGDAPHAELIPPLAFRRHQLTIAAPSSARTTSTCPKAPSVSTSTGALKVRTLIVRTRNQDPRAVGRRREPCGNDLSALTCKSRAIHGTSLDLPVVGPQPHGFRPARRRLRANDDVANLVVRPVAIRDERVRAR